MSQCITILTVWRENKMASENTVSLHTFTNGKLLNDLKKKESVREIKKGSSAVTGESLLQRALTRAESTAWRNCLQIKYQYRHDSQQGQNGRHLSMSLPESASL